MAGIVPLSQQLLSTAQDPDFHRISSLPTTGIVDSRMFFPYVPNTIKARKRTGPAQLTVLEDVFVTDKKPNALKRRELAEKLNLSSREIQVCVVLRAVFSFSFFLDRCLPHLVYPGFHFPLSSTPEYLTSSCLTKRCGSKTGAPRKRRRLPKRTH